MSNTPRKNRSQLIITEHVEETTNNQSTSPNKKVMIRKSIGIDYFNSDRITTIARTVVKLDQRVARVVIHGNKISENAVNIRLVVTNLHHQVLKTLTLRVTAVPTIHVLLVFKDWLQANQLINRLTNS